MDNNYLIHYGVGHLKGGHSGRYPWGSGDSKKKKISSYAKRAAGATKRGITTAAKTTKNAIVKTVKGQKLTRGEKIARGVLVGALAGTTLGVAGATVGRPLVNKAIKAIGSRGTKKITRQVAVGNAVKKIRKINAPYKKHMVDVRKIAMAKPYVGSRSMVKSLDRITGSRDFMSWLSKSEPAIYRRYNNGLVNDKLLRSYARDYVSAYRRGDLTPGFKYWQARDAYRFKMPFKGYAKAHRTYLKGSRKYPNLVWPKGIYK